MGILFNKCIPFFFLFLLLSSFLYSLLLFFFSTFLQKKKAMYQQQSMEKEHTAMSALHLKQYNLHPEFLAKYTLGEELGSGGYGFVVSARDNMTGIERAVKFIFRHKVPAHFWVTDKALGQVVPIEVSVLRSVHHPSIIKYIDFYQDGYFCYLVMELHGTQWAKTGMPMASTPPPRSPALSETSSYASSLDDEEHPMQNVVIQRRTSCDLFECIERHLHFDEGLARMIFQQIASCIAYLDLIGVCHRDIKDENIVIDDQYRVKLIDFGSAVCLPSNRKSLYLKQFHGTISFASPEILMGHAYRAEPAEVWSLGVLLYTLLFGEVPFHDPNMAMSGRFNQQPNITVSPKALHLITCMLNPSPEKRPTIHQVLIHPWFAEYF
jgi:serine/threonine protein kinase